MKRISFVKAHEREDGTSVRKYFRIIDSSTHDKQITSKGPNKENLKQLVNVTSKKPMVFPLGEYKPKKKTFAERLNSRFMVNYTSEPYGPRLSRGIYSFTAYNKKGEGTFHAYPTICAEDYVTPPPLRGVYKRQKVGPNVEITDKNFLFGSDYINTNMPGVKVKDMSISGVSWAGANIPDAKFVSTGGLYGGRRMKSVDFSGANLRNATFENYTFEQVDMRGADLTGVSFKVRLEKDGKYAVDLTDSNITEEQFDELLAYSFPDEWPYSLTLVKINRLSPEEFCEMTGADEEVIQVELWAGSMPFRSRVTDQVVENETYNGDKHYIPLWEAQKYLLANQ
jgi:hypothetical protein